jgi:hypothetical protein
MPEKVQLSSPPIKGKYKVKCVDKNGAASFSTAMDVNTSAEWIRRIVG